MFHDAAREQSALDAKTNAIEEAVRRLILMKETGPKSAAWHRARVSTIWRLQRQVEAARAVHRSSDKSADPAK